MYIITADIRGVKYYVRVLEFAHHGKIIRFQFEGLKNNATALADKTALEKHANYLECKTDWKLTVEKY